MPAKIEKILSEALDLPQAARAFLAEKLIESLDAAPAAELSPEWKEAVHRRCREIDDGLVELHDIEAVFARADTALK